MTTYTKLKDGTWGVRGKGLTTGQIVPVTKKSGESKDETVGHILWTGPDSTQIASIQQQTTRHYSPKRYGRGPIDRYGDCHCDMCMSGNECLCRYGNG
jgi:hypothetical protein